MNAKNETILVKGREIGNRLFKNAKTLTWDIVPSESLDPFLLVPIRVVCCAPKTSDARSQRV